MIQVKNLWHSYSGDEQYAIRDISFDVKEGEIFGFLGPSGSGKSTTQNIITGQLPLQKGEVSAAGFDMAKPQLRMYNEIGVCFEQARLVNIPWNCVQQEVANRCGSLTEAELLRRWQAGECLDIAGMDGLTATAPHVEVEARFISRT